MLASIDPDDPWACPDLSRLDRLSVGDWLREVGASPGVLRLWELVHLSLSDGSIERTSLFAYARKIVVGGTTGSYDVEQWENLRVAEGSATVALTMAGRCTTYACRHRCAASRSARTGAWSRPRTASRCAPTPW